jgi:hypothetical protein
VNVSTNPFHASAWRPVEGFADLADLTYHRHVSGATVRVAFKLVGQQLFAGEATRLAYMTDEAVEGRDAFLEEREPDYGRFPRYY